MRLTIQPFDKAKASPEGTISIWRDGTTRKKVGRKWVVVSRKDGSTLKNEKVIRADAWRRGQTLYDYAMASFLGGVVDKTLQEMGISGYDALVETIKNGSGETASKIYKRVVDAVRGSLSTPGDKKNVIDYFGRSLINLKEYYSAKPKTKLTVNVTSKKGTTWRKYAESPDTVSTELPSVKPSVIAKGKKLMGGWSVTGPLTSDHVKAMLGTGAATLLEGKIDSRKPWVLPKKAEDMEIKYKGDSLLVRVKQVRKVKERTKTVARVEIKIPYTFAKAFLLHQISSKRTSRNFIFRMERSSGYREFMEGAA